MCDLDRGILRTRRITYIFKYAYSVIEVSSIFCFYLQSQVYSKYVSRKFSVRFKHLYLVIYNILKKFLALFQILLTKSKDILQHNKTTIFYSNEREFNILWRLHSNAHVATSQYPKEPYKALIYNFTKKSINPFLHIAQLPLTNF